MYVEPFVKPRYSRNKNNNRRNRLEPEELDTDIKERIAIGAKLISYSDNSAEL
ncbi:MAG: hypothetical protein MRJ93_01000 [Nitrososphaeraceae archaeon]|nr:hypothetical protein [Nitrososphaeraceae archaeon]